MYADIVKRTGNKLQPPMKIKTKTSDDESICLDITQDPFLLKFTSIMITNPSEHQEKSVPNKNKKHNDNTRNSNKARATRFDVKKPQKNEFLDEISIGEIYDEESRTEPRENSTATRKIEYPKVEIAYSAKSSGNKYKYKNGTKIWS